MLNEANKINAQLTNSLSAIGSKNLPNLVTKLYFLAYHPSIKSVIEAIINIAPDTENRI